MRFKLIRPPCTTSYPFHWPIVHNNSKFILFLFKFHWSDCNEMLHMTWKLCCCGMCKQLMQSYNHEVQQAEIPIEFKLLVKIACEMGSYFFIGALFVPCRRGLLFGGLNKHWYALGCVCLHNNAHASRYRRQEHQAWFHLNGKSFMYIELF